MNIKMKELEESLPKESCSFCSHLSLEGPNQDYKYNIRCVLFDNIPHGKNACEYFSPEYTNLNSRELNNLYNTFLEACIKSKYEDYLNSTHWKLFREKTLDRYDYKCSICSSKENVDVLHLNKNLGRETFDDVIVICENCIKK